MKGGEEKRIEMKIYVCNCHSAWLYNNMLILFVTSIKTFHRHVAS